jgi:hypothetical protein
LVDLLQKIVGIQLCSNNIYWGDATYFRKRNITISSNYTPQYFRNVKLSVAALMKKDNNAKVVICSNTAKKLQGMQCSFDDWLNEVNIDGDSVLGVGDVKQELKYAYTIAFTCKSTTIGNSNNENGCLFNPKFLFGTSGCIGAGLDSDEVRLVLRLGMPTSLINLIQEMGRCGCQKEIIRVSNHNLDCYKIYSPLQDYIYLNERIFIEETENDEVNCDNIEGCNIVSKSLSFFLAFLKLTEVSLKCASLVHTCAPLSLPR